MQLGFEPKPHAKTGLVLSGGGARAAYQIGVLRAVNEVLPNVQTMPFEIVTGTSAGSLNAAILAAQAELFEAGISQATRMWHNIHASKVYKTGHWDVVRSLQHVAASILKHKREHKAVGLLDTAPLWRYVQQHIDFNAIRSNITHGNLQALGIAATSYAAGRSICFFEADDTTLAWNQGKSIGLKRPLGPEHLLGSCAIPFVLPPVKIGRHYYGDGAVRQISPLSNAIQLGAERLLVIGSSSRGGNTPIVEPQTPTPHSPSIGKIFGHVFSAAFLDAFDADVENVTTINTLLGIAKNHAPAEQLNGFSPIDLMVINPSEDVDAIARQHVAGLPSSIKRFINLLGLNEGDSANLISFLMFDAGFCRDLIRLGYEDGLHQAEQLLQFFHHTPISIAVK